MCFFGRDIKKSSQKNRTKLPLQKNKVKTKGNIQGWLQNLFPIIIPEEWKGL